MKKISLILTLFCITYFLSFTGNTVSAEEQESPYVSDATIEMILQDSVYTVKERIELANIQAIEDGKIEHILKQITENKVVDVKISSNGVELIPEIVKGDTFDKYSLDLSNEEGDTVEYIIEYNVNKAGSVFDVPLFVPEYATKGDIRTVHFKFQAPEGMIIQKNSFPIVNEAGLNNINKSMANIPAMTKFVLSEKQNVFNSFNVISSIALITLFLILLYWGIYEMKKKRRETNGS